MPELKPRGEEHQECTQDKALGKTAHSNSNILNFKNIHHAQRQLAVHSLVTILWNVTWVPPVGLGSNSVRGPSPLPIPFFSILTSPMDEKNCIPHSVSLTWQNRHSHSFTSEGFVHNELGFGGKVECTKSIKIVFVFRRNIGDHDGVCRATQRVL